jgi:integrase
MDSSALRRRYVAALKRADLRALRFHDLWHIFGSLAINYASIVPVQAWMGRADVNTTMRYPHHRRRADDAGLLSHAFRANGDDADGALGRRRERALDG